MNRYRFGSPIGDPRGRAQATLLLMGVLAAVWLVQELLGSSTSAPDLLRMGALMGDMPAADQPVRVLASVFLHAGLAHAAANTFGLWVIGPFVEARWGSARLVILFLGSALFGNLFYLATGPHPSLSVGASGGIFGLFGALLFDALQRRRGPGGSEASGWLIGIVAMLAYPLLLGVPVNHLAHIGGALGGLFLAAAVGEPRRFNPLLFLAAMVGLGAALAAAGRLASLVALFS